MIIEKKIFLKKLFSWYAEHKRNLPWRGEKDPYKIWVSEIILQQTKVVQGKNYYLNFIARFPTIEILAKSDITDVLKTWEGLGYYRRAIHLHLAACSILKEHGGKFPESYSEIRKLKGVGDYTAAAIASIAFHQPYPVLDGNVLRVFTRFFGIKKNINHAKTRSQILEMAKYYMDVRNPGDYNQAVMELGALVCLPSHPECSKCPLQKECMARKNHLTEKLPVRNKKNTKKNRYFLYTIFSKNKKIYLQKRDKNDIWKGMYEPHLMEFRSEKQCLAFVGKNGGTSSGSVKGPFYHILSHQKITAFSVIKEGKLTEKSGRGKFYHISEMQRLPLPVLVKKILHLHTEKFLK